MNAALFYKERKRTQRLQRSFIKDVKKRKERSVFFIKNAKECENVTFFWKERLPNPASTWRWRRRRQGSYQLRESCDTVPLKFFLSRAGHADVPADVHNCLLLPGGGGGGGSGHTTRGSCNTVPLKFFFSRAGHADVPADVHDCLLLPRGGGGGDSEHPTQGPETSSHGKCLYCKYI